MPGFLLWSVMSLFAMWLIIWGRWLPPKKYERPEA
jgi:hypothetical protein